MKIKISNIRLSSEHQQTDQDSLNNFLSSVTVIKTSTELITGQTNVWSILIFYEDKSTRKDPSSNEIVLETENHLTAEEETKFEVLKKWRQQKAADLNIPAYMVCHNKELVAITKTNPGSVEDFHKIRGFGEKKIENYGAELIEIMKR